VVAAYDLLNEPLPNEYQRLYAGRLRGLYKELTAAIREVDRNHMISYEGTHWATNWDIFTEVWDSNSILQFHKYWTPPDRPSIQRYIDAGRELGLPIYMGEGGENNLDWIQTVSQLYEDTGIPWTFWTWKKIDTLTSPCSVEAPSGWTAITDYAAGKGAKPDRASAQETLNQLLDAMPLSRCTYRPEVISALFRRPPLRIPAVGFGFRGAGESYRAARAVPLSAFRSDDLVTIRRADGVQDGELNWNHTRQDGDELLVGLGLGDWVAYDIVVPSPSRYQVAAALRPAQVHRGPAVDISIDGVSVDLEEEGESEVKGTTGRLTAGQHLVRLTGLLRETLVRWVEVRPA
jgi:hypothetical protein